MTDQNQKPDYSFIMNQPGFDQAPKKSSKKPLLFIGFGIVTLLLITGIALTVTRRSTNVVQQGTTDANSLDSARSTAQEYVELIETGKYGEAYDLVKPEDTKSVMSRETYIAEIGPLLQNAYDFSKCNVTENVASGDTYNTSMNCPYANNLSSEAFVFTSHYMDGQMMIVKISNPDRGVNS